MQKYKSPRTKVPEKPGTLIPQHKLRFRPKTFLAKAGSPNSWPLKVNQSSCSCFFTTIVIRIHG
jgi:hypothetical protein